MHTFYQKTWCQQFSPLSCSPFHWLRTQYIFRPRVILHTHSIKHHKPLTLPNPRYIFKRPPYEHVWSIDLPRDCKLYSVVMQRSDPSKRCSSRYISHVALNGFFYECNCHDYLQTCLCLRMDHLLYHFMTFVVSKRWLFRLEAVRCVFQDLWGRGANAKKNVYQSTAFQWRRGLQ